MNHDVIITCALTGAGDTTARSPHVPVTPKQIAAAAVEAAKAGATVVHCHVRDPETGKFSRDVALYREVMERIREADIDIIVNLTAGMGGDLEIGGGENPMAFGPNTDLVGPLTRLAHVEELLPEICTRPPAISVRITGAVTTSPLPFSTSRMAMRLPTFSRVMSLKMREPAESRLRCTAGSCD